MSMGPRFLYLHGFASGPNSKKGVALEQHFAARGLRLERLDLRVPSLERLSFAAMLSVLERAIGGPRDRAVVIGSSMGALTAARVAERDARVCALVLLAPAFRFVERWRARMGEAAWRQWEQSDALTVADYANGGQTQIHFAVMREIEALDRGLPDVRVPTLIVHGVQDDTVDIGLSREFAAGQRHVQLVEVDDGHELVASLPRITAEIDRFLQPFGI
jgi:pimeloyl-ACP methyl ester carboxylesterase